MGIDLVVVGLFGISVGTVAIIFREQLRQRMFKLRSDMYGKFDERFGDGLRSWWIAVVGTFFVICGVTALTFGILRMVG